MSKRKSVVGLRRDRRKQSYNQFDESQYKRDFKLVKKRIIENSLSNEWDEARREWELEKIIEQGYMDLFDRFTENCELCNQPGLKTNYLIINRGTNKKFLVGSRCIKKFLLLKGAQSQQESAEIFEFEAKKKYAEKKLHSLISDMLSDEVDYSKASSFRNSSKVILGTLNNKLIESAKWDEYIYLLFGPKPPAGGIDRIRSILFEPNKVRYKKRKMETGEEEGRWAHKQKVKKKHETTLSRSEVYRPDKLNYDN